MEALAGGVEASPASWALYLESSWVLRSLNSLSSINPSSNKCLASFKAIFNFSRSNVCASEADEAGVDADVVTNSLVIVFMVMTVSTSFVRVLLVRVLLVRSSCVPL